MAEMGTFTLQNGVKIPDIGYGTYLINEGSEGAIISAVEAGYRLFDTASFYKNEETVGRALRQSGLPREEIFLTSKIWKTDMGYEKARESFEISCEKLGASYLDLLLIHYPKPFTDCTEWKQIDLETWAAMEELYEAGRLRAIGVSNFYPHHLKNLFDHCRVAPMVDQIEFHPGFTQWAVVDYCRRKNILVEAWRPFGKRRVLQDVRVQDIAAKYGVTPAQLCIRYAMQEGLLPLAKSADPVRMRQNLNVRDFQISEEDLYYIRCLPQFGWSGEHPDFDRDMTALER